MQNQDDTALLDAAETGLVDTVLLLLDRGEAREEVKLQLGEHFFLSSVEAAQAGAL